MTTLHLVRHASHGLLGRVLTGRMPGVGLSEAGRVEAALLADGLAGAPITAVVSSPMQRARETAGPIAARLGLAVTIDAGLDEIDFGEWTGLGFEALAEREDWARWNRVRSLVTCPGGESMLEAQARAADAVMRHRGGEVVLVSHQDVLKAVLAHLLGAPLDMMSRFALDPAHRATVRMFEDGVRIDNVNLPP